MALFLVRHGRPVIERGRPAEEWQLDLDRWAALAMPDLIVLARPGDDPDSWAVVTSPD